MLILAFIVLMWMLDTSCAERGFATMNDVHSALRNLLSVEHVRDIMTNILLGPKLKDFDPKVILEMWMKGPLGDASEHGRYLRGKLKDALDGVGMEDLATHAADLGL